MFGILDKETRRLLRRTGRCDDFPERIIVDEIIHGRMATSPRNSLVDSIDILIHAVPDFEGNPLNVASLHP